MDSFPSNPESESDLLTKVLQSNVRYIATKKQFDHLKSLFEGHTPQKIELIFSPEFSYEDRELLLSESSAGADMRADFTEFESNWKTACPIKFFKVKNVTEICQISDDFGVAAVLIEIEGNVPPDLYMEMCCVAGIRGFYLKSGEYRASFLGDDSVPAVPRLPTLPILPPLPPVPPVPKQESIIKPFLGLVGSIIAISFAFGAGFAVGSTKTIQPKITVVGGKNKIELLPIHIGPFRKGLMQWCADCSMDTLCAVASRCWFVPKAIPEYFWARGK